MSSIKSSLCFWFWIAAILAVRLFFLVDLPLGQSVKHHLEGLNDEPSHYNYVKYIIDHHAFPVQTHSYKEPGALQRNDYVFYHSPLYYLSATPGYALFGAVGGLYWSRMISFICGIVSLFLLSGIFKKMGCPAHVQRAAIVCIGFFPCHAYFCSLTSNDSMSWALALVVTYCCLGDGKNNLDHPDITMRRAILIGVLLAAGFLVKVSLIMFFPLVALTFLYTWHRTKNNVMIVKMFVAFGIACLLIAPWVARNLYLYHSLTAIPLIVGPPVISGSLPMIAHGIFDMAKGTIRFFWFPMQHIPPSVWQRPIGIIGAMILVFCLVLSLRYFLAKRRIRYNDFFLILLLLINIVSYIKVNRTWGDWEARYLFPSLASIVYFMIVPLNDALASLRMDRLFFPLTVLLGTWGYSYLLLTL